MPLLRRPGGVLEVRTAQFRCRLQPLGPEGGYRVYLFHCKENGFTDSRIIFNFQDPDELLALLQIVKQMYEASCTALAG